MKLFADKQSPEYPERTYTYAGRKCKLNTETPQAKSQTQDRPVARQQLNQPQSSLANTNNFGNRNLPNREKAHSDWMSGSEK